MKINDLVSQLKAGIIDKDQIFSHVRANQSTEEPATASKTHNIGLDSADNDAASEDEIFDDDGKRDSFDDLDDENMKKDLEAPVPTNEFGSGNESMLNPLEKDSVSSSTSNLSKEFVHPESPNQRIDNGNYDVKEAWSINPVPANQGTLGGDQQSVGTLNTTLDDVSLTLNTTLDDVSFGERLAPTERLYRDSKVIEERRRNLAMKYNIEKEKKFKSECPFKPQLPIHQGRTATVERGGYSAPTTSFKNRMTNRNPKHHPPAPSVTVVSESNESTASPPTSFTDFDDEDLRFRRDSWLKFEGNGAVYNDMAECTFSPRTNAIKAARMPSASEYTKQDVIIRLTPKTPQRNKPRIDQRNSHESTEFAQEAQQQRFLKQYQSYQVEEPSPVPSRQTKTEVRKSAELSTPTQSFHDMMKRQAQHLLKANENRRRTEQEQTPSFKPHINSKSTQMVTESGKGDFEQRLELQLLGRNSEKRFDTNPYVDLKGGFLNDDDDSCTNLDHLVDGICGDHQDDQSSMNISIFIDDLVRDRSFDNSYSKEATYQPCITAKATALPRRSFEDMSLGDARRREVAARKVMAQQAKKEERKLTLRPRLTKLASKSPSSLRLHDIGSYTTRVQDAKRVKEERMARLKQEQVEISKRECTFTPMTTTCPSYVRRMAHAHSAQKPPSNGKKHPPKQEWR